MLTPADAAVLAAGIVAFSASALRWLRVAQREHYLPGSVLRFAFRWWRTRWWSALLICCSVIGEALALHLVVFGLLGAAVAGMGPFGLALRGRTSPLALTRRLRSLGALTAFLAGAAIALGGVLDDWHGAAVAAVAVALVAPALVDGASALLSPVESKLAGRFVSHAARRLREVHPVVLAITGSYGKTTTKGYATQLLSGRFQVLASPRSFNNQAGLARTVNELLVPGTDILVAEMGTYGPGELAALCSWLTPTVAVITAIGPVHLERFGSLEQILAAKAEITELASASVLNADDEMLAALAESLDQKGKRVVRCSGQRRDAEVAVVREEEATHLYLAGSDHGAIELPGAVPSIVLSNVACAIGAALELGCQREELLVRLGDLPVAENRLQQRIASSGAVILDDTFNSNPAGTRLALATLAATPADRRVVVTPGMVELGPVQAEENERFGEAVGWVASDVVVVGRTNRRALLAGLERAESAGASPRVHVVSHREEAAAFVRASLGPHDAVLYENDLPDHYP